MEKLHSQISNIIDKSICDKEQTYIDFLERLEKSSLTRDENPKSHFCAYFLPYNPKNKKIFIVHHRKANIWLSPGGHIDKDEGLLDTLNREINEELGMKNFFKELPLPFLLTITPIERKVHPCKEHLDIWYLMKTDGSKFNIDPREFNDTKWMAIDEAKKIVIDPPNKKALEVIRSLKSI